MTSSGWIFLIVSWSFILFLMIASFTVVLRKK